MRQDASGGISDVLPVDSAALEVVDRTRQQLVHDVVLMAVVLVERARAMSSYMASIFPSPGFEVETSQFLSRVNPSMVITVTVHISQVNRAMSGKSS